MSPVRQVGGYWIREAKTGQEHAGRITCTNSTTILKPAPKGQR